MTGYHADELLGRGHAFLHAPTDIAAMRRWCRRLSVDRSLSGENTLNHKAGAGLYASWTFSALADSDGNITHVVGSYRDMTEKRRLQEALVHSQRLDAVGRLAGGVAHDFNNLLSVINGYCEILTGTLEGQAKALKEVSEIHRAGQRAAILVRQLLAFGRRQTMDPRVINLNELIRENANILARLIFADKTLELSLDEQLSNVFADPGQLQQVLLNLTINARDALSPGGRVTISTSNRVVRRAEGRRTTDVAPGRYVVLAVHDNGRGMDAATQGQLFEPFFTTKGEGKGTGLGLALVYGVVQQSSGHITVHSAPELGSTFEILLPAVNTPAASPPDTAGPLPVTTGTAAVVLADPDDLVRKMVGGILTSDGFDVVAVPSASEAREHLERNGRRIDLLIIDPGDATSDGMRLARSLLQRHPDSRVLWTPGEEMPPIEGLPAGSQACLAKPFALRALLRTVHGLLNQRASSNAERGTRLRSPHG